MNFHLKEFLIIYNFDFPEVKEEKFLYDKINGIDITLSLK